MSDKLIVFLIVFFVSGVISFIWAFLIEDMHQKHPDYKGEDFLNWDKDEWNKK